MSGRVTSESARRADAPAAPCTTTVPDIRLQKPAISVASDHELEAAALDAAAADGVAHDDEGRGEDQNGTAASAAARAVMSRRKLGGRTVSELIAAGKHPRDRKADRQRDERLKRLRRHATQLNAYRTHSVPDRARRAPAMFKKVNGGGRSACAWHTRCNSRRPGAANDFTAQEPCLSAQRAGTTARAPRPCPCSAAAGVCFGLIAAAPRASSPGAVAALARPPLRPMRRRCRSTVGGVLFNVPPAAIRFRGAAPARRAGAGRPRVPLALADAARSGRASRAGRPRRRSTGCSSPSSRRRSRSRRPSA